MIKGLISGIKRMEIHDGDGLRTTVFFKGCPLKCIWCHNPESISFEKQTAFFEQKCIHCGVCQNERNEKSAKICPTDALHLYGTEYSIDELTAEVLKDRSFFGLTGGVTLSGGECLAQPEFAVGLAKRLFDLEISVYVDTCGYVPQKTFEQILPYTDCFLYDVKAIDKELHKIFTGQSNEIILENLQYLLNMGAKLEIRYPLIKGCNDSECEKIGRFLKEAGEIRKVKVLQYHPFAASRYKALGMENTLPHSETTFEDVDKAVNILKNYNLNAVNGMAED